MKKIISILALSVSTIFAQTPPPIVYDIESNWQQTQSLQDQTFVQGAGVVLRYRVKTANRWWDLSNLGARWDARESITSTNAYQATATVVTNTTPNYFQITLDSDQTGTAIDNWVYSLIVTTGGIDYPIGTGSVSIAASAWTGPAAKLLNQISVDFTAVTNYTGVFASGPYDFSGGGFSVTTNANGSLLLTSTAGTPSWDDVTGKPFTNLVDLTTNNLTGIDWGDIGGGGGDITGVTAGTGLSGGGVSGDVTLDIDTATYTLITNSVQSGALDAYAKLAGGNEIAGSNKFTSALWLGNNTTIANGAITDKNIDGRGNDIVLGWSDGSRQLYNGVGEIVLNIPSSGAPTLKDAASTDNWEIETDATSGRQIVSYRVLTNNVATALGTLPTNNWDTAYSWQDWSGPVANISNRVVTLEGQTNIYYTAMDQDVSSTGTPTFASVKTPILQATTSAGIAIKSSNGTTGLTVGAGGGANVSTSDGLSVNGALSVQGTNVMSSIVTLEGETNKYLQASALTDYVTNGVLDAYAELAGATFTGAVTTGVFNATGAATFDGNVTAATGTVSAEQLTSTDDATITDDLTVGVGSGADRQVHISAGATATNSASLKMGTTNRDWTLTARPFNLGGNVYNYAMTLDYTGTDSPLSDVLRIQRNGNIGLGTNAPSYKLDVNGTLRATGNADFNAGVDVTAGALTVGATNVIAAINAISMGSGFVQTNHTGDVSIDGELTVSIYPAAQEVTTATTNVTWGEMNQYMTPADQSVITFAASPVDAFSRLIDLTVNQGTNSVTWPSTNLPHFAWSAEVDTTQLTNNLINVILSSMPQSSNVVGRIIQYE